MGEYAVARARLERARTHKNKLAEFWNGMPDGRLLTPRSLVDDNGYGVLIATKVGTIPDEMALLLGEMLYQLRAALDACIYQAAVYTTQDPPPKEGSLEFPITSDPKEWPKLAERRLGLLHVDIQNAIERVQPYNNQQLPPEQMVSSLNRSLGILNDLARKDRHRKLHLVGSWPHDMQPDFHLPDGVGLHALEVQPPSIIEDGTVLAKFRLTGWQSEMTASVNPRLRTVFGCNELPMPCHPSDTFERRLVEMVNVVNSTIYAFETYA